MSVISAPMAADEATTTTWTARPRVSTALRIAVVALPIVAGWSVAWALRGWFWSADGVIGFLIWAAQCVAIGGLVAAAVAQATGRARPVADLFELWLTFPGPAPSRAAMARRLACVRDRQHRIDELMSRGLDDEPTTAAVEAVELVLLVDPDEHLAARHTKRVRHYVDLIAVEMGVSPADREKLAWAVLLHDVGARSVDAELRRSALPLTEEQREMVTAHPSASHDFLEPLAPWLGTWRMAALDHHERWDRSGYPRGIGGRMISLAGRITAVADAYAAMTSTRSYKPTHSHHTARRELVEGSATQFDPDVVRAFLAVSPERRRTLGRLASLQRTRLVAGATAGAPAGLAVVIATVGIVGTALASTAIGPPSSPPALAFDAADDPSSDGLVPSTEQPRPSTTTVTSSDISVPTSLDLPTTTTEASTTTTEANTSTVISTTGSTTTTSTTEPSTTTTSTTEPSTTAPSTTAPKTTISIATTAPGVTISIGN